MKLSSKRTHSNSKDHLMSIQLAQLRQRDRASSVGDFKGVGHFEAIFWVEGLCFAPISMDS